MAKKNSLYDLDEIRAIPILDVCAHLGLEVKKRGKDYWCKVRNETNASVIIHADRNYFYDFGNKMHGSNIDLVQYVRGGCSIGEAIRDLAKAFHIAPNETREDQFSRPMNQWEYKKIGLYGDMATKNLVFPVADASVNDLLDMEYAYRMPMNDLKSKHPDVYRHILKTKAIPFVQDKRESYYQSVWNYFCFLKILNRHSAFFDSEKTAAKFEDVTKDLEQSERSLFKACQGTGLLTSQQMTYDPQRVFSYLARGKISFSLGPLSSADVIEQGKATQEKVFEKFASYDDYCAAFLDGHPHSAEFSQGAVKILCPESEKAFFDYQFPPRPVKDKRLDDILQEAEQRRETSHSKRQEKQPEPVR